VSRTPCSSGSYVTRDSRWCRYRSPSLRGSLRGIRHFAPPLRDRATITRCLAGPDRRLVRGPLNRCPDSSGSSGLSLDSDSQSLSGFPPTTGLPLQPAEIGGTQLSWDPPLGYPEESRSSPTLWASFAEASRSLLDVRVAGVEPAWALTLPRRTEGRIPIR
jgi:hypothetical protein